MADDPAVADGAGQTSETTLAGFHRGMQKRTTERDAALAENARLKAEIAELAAYAPDESDEPDDTPTPRSTNAPREVRQREPEFDAQTALGSVFNP
jgi:hypothetical protein